MKGVILTRPSLVFRNPVETFPLSPSLLAPVVFCDLTFVCHNCFEAACQAYDPSVWLLDFFKLLWIFSIPAYFKSQFLQCSSLIYLTCERHSMSNLEGRKVVVGKELTLKEMLVHSLSFKIDLTLEIVSPSFILYAKSHLKKYPFLLQELQCAFELKSSNCNSFTSLSLWYLEEIRIL